MSTAINQFGLHTIEYAIRKKQLEDPLYIAAHPEALPPPPPHNYAYNTPYDTCTTVPSTLYSSIDLKYADQLAKNVWAKPSEDSPSMYKPREGELFDNPKLRHTLELNAPYVPYGGYVHPRVQNKWEESPGEPPQISKDKARQKFPVVLSSMSKYVEEMNTMEQGFKLY